ncbi:MAG: phosphatase family protein [Gemmatimonadetes bacterium]|nr:phosphatase family protein [Gemmatimonadota bacterium]
MSTISAGADDLARRCPLCPECVEEACKPCGGERPEIGEYRLSGPQVEPGASYWNYCPVPCPVSIKDLLNVTEDPASPHFFPPYPSDPAVVQAEFAELVELEHLRYDPTRLASTTRCRERCPLSTFLQLRPVPLGANANFARGDGFPVVYSGAELARYFENETPGLAHRQALNYLIRDTGWSPPRQALVWAALDVAIYSALSAAWYYKWLSPRPYTSRRERPWEFADANGCTLNVLFDRPLNGLGSDSVDDLVSYTTDPPRLERNGRRPDFFPPAGFPYINTSPGTPRHPAYPSGHSTYSGAASELLSFFFPDYRGEFDRLADNIGLARLWAGVHWRSDHTAGNKLGRTVACLVIDQLRRSGIPLVPGPAACNDVPPPRDALEEQAKLFGENCGNNRPGPVPGTRCRVLNPCSPARLLSAEEAKAGAEPDATDSDTQGRSFVG